MKILSAFGMADDDISATDILEHTWGDFSGECSLIFVMHILRSKSYEGAFNCFVSAIQGGKRRSYNYFTIFDVRRAFFDRLSQGNRFTYGVVHFPIAGYNPCSHCFPPLDSSAATPGRSCLSAIPEKHRRR